MHENKAASVCGVLKTWVPKIALVALSPCGRGGQDRPDPQTSIQIGSLDLLWSILRESPTPTSSKNATNLEAVHADLQKHDLRKPSPCPLVGTPRLYDLRVCSLGLELPCPVSFCWRIQPKSSKPPLSRCSNVAVRCHCFLKELLHHQSQHREILHMQGKSKKYQKSNLVLKDPVAQGTRSHTIIQVHIFHKTVACQHWEWWV